MLLILDSRKDVSALVWNGSAFTAGVLLDNNAQNAGNELIDAAYERLSGRCVVIWSVKNTGTPSYQIWSGAGWGPELTLPDIGGKGDWDRMAADPASNKIIAMFLDKSSDINVSVWSGSAWGPVSEFETSAAALDRRGFDVAFEPAGTRAVAMYGRAGQNYAYFRTFSGSAWSAEQTGPGLGEPVSVVQMSPAPFGREIMIGIERMNDGALCGLRWNGSAMVDFQVLAPDLGGPNGNECFMFTPGPAGLSAVPRIFSWREVDPGT
jgi:hypothetical protein